MIDLTTKEEYQKIISNNAAVILYFSTPQCNVCKVLKPKLEELISTEFPKVKMCYINGETLPEITAQQRIFTVPTILFLLDGKEYIRRSRNISVLEFQAEIERPYNMYFKS